MKTIAEIRLDNLDLLIAEKGTQELVAALAGTSSVYLSQIKNRAADTKTGKLRQMGDDMARKLESGCEKEVGWMDNLHPEFAAAESPRAYPTGRDNPLPSPLATETVLRLPAAPTYDKWTLAAIELMQDLDPEQRLAMVARMRDFKQHLGPPRNGQALSVAG